MPRMDSWAARRPSARTTLEEPRELVHVLVEEREHRDRAVAALLEILIHEIGIRVAREEPHLDIRLAVDQLGHIGHVRQTGATPVLADDEHPARPGEPLQHAGVLGLDRGFFERLDELLPVEGHLVDVLLKGQPLLEAFLRDHGLSSWGAFPPARLPYHGSLEAHPA